MPEVIERRRCTVREYLDLEAESDVKHDYFEGHILDMAGGSLRHNTIALNLAAELRQMTVTNPQAIAEVLSPSTESYDQGDKFKRYVLIPTLRDYLVVKQTEPQVARFHRRDDDSWLIDSVEGLDAALEIPSLGVTLSMAEIYRDVTFDAPTAQG
jgi:Uma2 family endonuclease